MSRLIRRAYAVSPISFVPTAELTPTSIPRRPDFSKTPLLYHEIVKPLDVCDVVIRPTPEDRLVTILAKKLPFSGDTNYTTVSKSKVSASSLMYGNLADRWLAEFGAIPVLQEVQNPGENFDFMSRKDEDAILALLLPATFASAGSVAEAYSAFSEKHTPETTARVMLRYSPQHSDWIFQLMAKHTDSLNPLTLPTYLAQLMNIVREPDQADAFETYLSEAILPKFPDILKTLDPQTLSQLAAVAASSLNMATALLALTHMVQVHNAAPPHPVYVLCMLRFCKHAEANNYDREAVYRALAPVKAVVHHHGLTPPLFKVLLRVVNHPYELAHLVRLSHTEELAPEHVSAVVKKFLLLESTNQLSTQCKVRFAQLAATLRKRSKRRTAAAEAAEIDAAISTGLKFFT